MQARSKALIGAAVILFLSPLFASAGVPTQVTYQSGTVDVPFYGYSDSGNCATSCLQEQVTSAYHDSSIFTSTEANYTNFGCTQGGATMNFGVGINGGVAVMSCPGAVTASTLTLTFSASSGATYAYFYYQSKNVNVYQVTSGGNTVVAANYVPNAGSLTTCTAPCVYNQGTYVEAKLGSPANVAFYIQANGGATSTSTAGAGGGGGGGNPPPPPPPPPPSPSPSPAPGGGGNPGFLTVTSTITLPNGLVTTTVVTIPATGNPAQVPTGLFVFFLIMATTFGYALYRRRGGKDLGIRGEGKKSSPSGKRKGTR